MGVLKFEGMVHHCKALQCCTGKFISNCSAHAACCCFRQAILQMRVKTRAKSAEQEAQGHQTLGNFYPNHNYCVLFTEMNFCFPVVPSTRNISINLDKILNI